MNAEKKDPRPRWLSTPTKREGDAAPAFDTAVLAEFEAAAADPETFAAARKHALARKARSEAMERAKAAELEQLARRGQIDRREFLVSTYKSKTCMDCHKPHLAIHFAPVDAPCSACVAMDEQRPPRARGLQRELLIPTAVSP